MAIATVGTGSQSRSYPLGTWTNQTVQFTPSAINDTNSALRIAKVSYSSTGASNVSGSYDARTGQAPVIALSADGITTVQIFAENEASLISGARSFAVMVDKTAPVSAALLTGTKLASGAYSGSVKIAVSASDPISGVAGLSWLLDGGKWTPATNPFALTITAKGAHSFLYYGKDRAGNIEKQQSITFTIQ